MEEMNLEQLSKTAEAMVRPGKGILAADESSSTIKKRFDAIGVDSTADNRRDYRELLFRSTEAMRNYVSGVILYDETIRQTAKDGTPLVKIIADTGAIPGIKVDSGAKPLPFSNGETVTEGLDGLRERLKEYHGLGARFAKWRAVIDIGERKPSYAAILANAHAIARYAALCQEADIVPIVEPEILMDGDHDIDACEEATGRTLDALYRQMVAHRLDLPGTLLKVNMIVPGKGSAVQDDDATIAEATIRCLSEHVPASVPGVVFLSGGMSDEQATTRLDAMNRMLATGDGAPWALSFSYGRALQAPALTAWGGDPRKGAGGRRALAHRATMNGRARDGAYDRAMESAA